MPHRVGRALARMRAHRVDLRTPRGPADHDHWHGGGRELLRVRFCHVERSEDEPVDEAVLEVAHHGELVLRVGAGGVEHQPQALGTGDLLDRADHRRVHRVADVGHRERDLARPARPKRAGGCVRDVPHRLGGLRDPRESVGVRANPVQDPGGGRNGDVRQASDSRDRRHSVVRLARRLHPPSPRSEKVY